MASRWTTALVEPPIAASATIALWNDARVRTALGRRSCADHLDGEPAGRVRASEQPAVRRRGAGHAGQRHAERLGQQRHRRGGAHRVAVAAAADHRRLGAAGTPPADSVPARTSSLTAATRRCRSPAACRGRCRSASGRRARRRPGRSTDAAAISSAGIVLSQPPSSTTPSIGLARSISSVAIAAMLRQSIAVGRTCVSPSDTTGRFERDAARLVHALLTLSATSSRWALHGVRSEAVLAMAICGRPSNAWAGSPGASRRGGCRRCGRRRVPLRASRTPSVNFP